MTPPDWTEAACRGYEPELWFADYGSGAAAHALTICRRQCPIRQQCLRWALHLETTDPRTTSHHGIWGGYRPDQRRQLINKTPAGRATVNANAVAQQKRHAVNAAERTSELDLIVNSGATINDALREMDMTRDALYKWCLRNGALPQYRTLAARCNA